MVELHLLPPRLSIGVFDIVRKNGLPAAGEALAPLAHLRVGLEAAVLQLDTRAGGGGAEPHLDLGGCLPIRRFPGEQDQARRVAAHHPADLKLGAVDEALVKAAARVVVEKYRVCALAPVGETAVEWPPAPDLAGEHPERLFRRAADDDRFADRHRASS